MSTTRLITTRAALREARAGLSGTVAVVMTMGALHDGHLQLVHRAREVADAVVLTDFVNPLQFGPGEDYEAYPRQIDADLALVDGLVDVVFAPPVEEMYPVLPPVVSVSAGQAGRRYEGAMRPGHFDGVLTVVTKLLNLVQPHVAVFGRKDAQQLALVQGLVADLDLPVRIDAVDIMRDATGLALSSRNAYLSDAGREQALVLSRTIRAVEAAAPSAAAIRAVLDADADGTQPVDAATDTDTASAGDTSAGEPSVHWDYRLLIDPTTFEEAGEDARGELLVMLAARIEGTRLLDATVVPVTQP